MTLTFCLSVAELAFAMAQSGNTEAAFGYWQTMLGDIAPEHFGDWMTAASHALVARDLLQMHPDGGYGELNADLRQVAQAIVRDLRTLRCHRLRQSPDGAVDRFVSLLFDENLMLAHWIEQRVVAMVQPIPTRGAAYSHVAAFIGVQTDNPFAAQSRVSQQWAWRSAFLRAMRSGGTTFGAYFLRSDPKRHWG
ncbi:MAG: hypothetical protein CVU38_17595, partial [Chloroflexi bacterium HGW-Chloroflexi-1]